MGKAIELAYNNIDEYNKKLIDLREYFFEEVSKKIPNIKINGDRKNRLPGNANVSIKGIDGEDLLLNLDAKGICVSTGSACNSESQDPSHVLLAIGLSQELANGALRVTFGKENEKDDVDFLIDNLVEIVTKLRKV